MYQILGTYRGNTEILDTAESEDDATSLVWEYRMAFGDEWAISFIESRWSFYS